MEPFHLMSTAREVVLEDTTRNKQLMAEELRKRIPEQNAEEALCEALYYVVNAAFSVMRFGNARPQVNVASGPGGGGSGSRKQEAIRDNWRKWLDATPYTVGDGSVRMLGDMNVQDLQFVAAKLQQQAHDRAARARLLGLYEKALRKNGAERVRDLPDSVLRALRAQE